MTIVTTTRGRNGSGTPGTPIQTKDIADNAVTSPKLSEDVRQSLAAAAGAVRYDAAQELTEEERVRTIGNATGLRAVYIDASEFGKPFSEDRISEFVAADIIVAKYDNVSYSFIHGIEAMAGVVYYNALYANEMVLRMILYTTSKRITAPAPVQIKDVRAVYYKEAQNLTSYQQLQARKNINAMANMPSGDPMHYIYETAGAEWIPYADISTEGLEDWQVATLDRAQAQADGGVWWHNDIFVTVEQNRINYILTIGQYTTQLNTYALYLTTSRATTNYKEQDSGGYSPVSASDAGCACACVTIYFPAIALNNAIRAFRNNLRLYRILGTVNVGIIANANNLVGIFSNTPNLRDVSLKGLNANVDLSTNTHLNVASVAYMITNAGTASFTITLASAVYASAMADADVQAALAAKPNVTLADAGTSSSDGN